VDEDELQISALKILFDFITLYGLGSFNFTDPFVILTLVVIILIYLGHLASRKAFSPCSLDIWTVKMRRFSRLPWRDVLSCCCCAVWPHLSCSHTSSSSSSTPPPRRISGMCVCMSVCLYVGMYVGMYVWMDVCSMYK
jgi:hypothetical protein